MAASLQKQPSTDESKTYDHSVLIHEDIETVAVSIDELLTTKSVPANLHKLNSQNDQNDQNKLQPQSTSPSKKHARDVSVGNLVPSRYLNQASSLIALLDVQNTRTIKNVGFNTMRPSKSMPDYNNGGNNTPSLNSDGTFHLAPLHDDFDGPPTEINGNKHESTDNVFENGQLHDNDNNVISMILTNNASSTDSIINKKQEYEEFIPHHSDNDQMVDMQLLAAKAAEEFTILANENDKLFKQNITLKEKYDDILHYKSKLEQEVNSLKNKHEDNRQILDDIEHLKSAAAKWEIEKKVLISQLNAGDVDDDDDDDDINNKNKLKTYRNKNSDDLIGKTALKLSRDTSEDAQRLMMESLAKITREKNELELIMEREKNMKREYEKTISNLKKQLKDNEIDREILSSNLDKQQKLYLSLKENAKKKELEIDNIVDRTRTLTLEEEEEAKKAKMELLEAVDEQKAYIEELEAENQKLMASKIRDDDQMFYQLQQLRTHRFARSMQFDGNNGMIVPSDYGDGQSNHSRGGSQSLSNYSTSGIGQYAIFNQQQNINNINNISQSTTDLQLKAVRTQINMFNIDYGDEFNDDETKMINYPIKEEDNKPDIVIDIDAEPLPSTNGQKKEKEKKKVSFLDNNNKELVEQKEKESLKRKKREEMFKVNAEIEFFLMTCIAIKTNLVEEYPNKPEVITEDAMKLFEEAQKEHVIMSKFNLWIEYKLREKYDLPKLEGFQKFLEKYHIKDKISSGIDKTKEKSKKLAKKTGKLAKKTGYSIKEKTEEIGQRIRAYSKGNYSDNEQNDDYDQQQYKIDDNQTIDEKEENEEKKEENNNNKNNNNQNTNHLQVIDKKISNNTNNANNTTTTKSIETNKENGDDNPPNNNNVCGCIIL